VDRSGLDLPQGPRWQISGSQVPSHQRSPDVNPTTLAITTFPTPSTPTIIRPGNANNLLFTEFSANKIASITIDGVVAESQEFPGSGAPVGITAAVASKRVLFLGVGHKSGLRKPVVPALSEAGSTL